LDLRKYFGQQEELEKFVDEYRPGAVILLGGNVFLLRRALSVSFIPVFNDRIQSGNKKSAWDLSTSLVNLLAIITLIASVLMIIFADPLVRYVVGPGLDEVGRGLAVSMMRVIAINPFLFAIASVLASVQQAVGRFVFFALSPVIYNLGIIIGILFFSNGISFFGFEVFEGGIMGVALGVVLGSVMQLAVSAVGLMGLGFDYTFKIHWKIHKKTTSRLTEKQI
jgi:putative peptidoglycan lipid II flippase